MVALRERQNLSRGVGSDITITITMTMMMMMMIMITTKYLLAHLKFSMPQLKVTKKHMLKCIVFSFARYTVKRSKDSIGMSVIMDPMANK